MRNAEKKNLECGSRKKVKPTEPGNKLIEKSVFLTLWALPHALCLCFFIPNSAFPLPNSNFCLLTSVLWLLIFDCEWWVVNDECRRKEFYRFLLIQKTERSDSVLRDSAVCCLSKARPSKRQIWSKWRHPPAESQTKCSAGAVQASKVLNSLTPNVTLT